MNRKLLSTFVIGSVVSLGASAMPAVAETRPEIDVSQGLLTTVEYDGGVNHLVVVPVQFVCGEGLRYRIDLVLTQQGVSSREASYSHECSGVEEVSSLGFGNASKQEFEPGKAEAAVSLTILTDHVEYWGASVSKEITLTNTQQEQEVEG